MMVDANEPLHTKKVNITSQWHHCSQWQGYYITMTSLLTMTGLLQHWWLLHSQFWLGKRVSLLSFCSAQLFQRRFHNCKQTNKCLDLYLFLFVVCYQFSLQVSSQSQHLKQIRLKVEEWLPSLFERRERMQQWPERERGFDFDSNWIKVEIWY